MFIKHWQTNTDHCDTYITNILIHKKPYDDEHLKMIQPIFSLHLNHLVFLV